MRTKINLAFANMPEKYLDSWQLIKKLVLIQQNRNRFTLPLVIERVKRRTKRAWEELKWIPAAILMEDQVRVVSNEIFREYNKAVGRHTSDDYKINVEKATEAFDANTCNK